VNSSSRRHPASVSILTALPLLVCGVLAAAAPAAATTFKIDAVHSSVLFKVKHFGVANVYGRFNEIAGTIEYDNAVPEKSSVQFEIRTDSVDTHAEGRDNHLKSADFFNAAQFPTIAFNSTKVEKTGETTFRVTGDLTLLGVTKPTTFEVELTGEGKHPRSQKAMIGFESHGTIQRSNWGMEFMNGPLSDEVQLILSFEAGAE
jgi:polyisoprenoid-binding protein YceI